MHLDSRAGEALPILGLVILIAGATGIVTNTLSSDVTVPMSAMALIFTGAGIGLKKKGSR